MNMDGGVHGPMNTQQGGESQRGQIWLHSGEQHFLSFSPARIEEADTTPQKLMEFPHSF